MTDNVVYINKPPEVLREESLEEAIRLVGDEIKNGNVSSMIVVLVTDSEEKADVVTLLAGEIMQEDRLLAVGLLESVKFHIISHLTD